MITSVMSSPLAKRYEVEKTICSARIGFAAALAIACLMLAGCSSRVTGPQRQVRDVGGMLIEVSVRPGLPQDSASAATSTGAQVGDDTLVITLHDEKSNAVIPDANVSAAPSTSLVGSQRAESGRSQGNGVYLVPIRFAVPDTYTILVTVDRPAKSETSAQFTITAN
jgi:hypothetical protein